MDSIIENILNYESFIEPYIDPLTNEILNFSLNKVFEDDQIINLNNNEFRFNVIEYDYEKPRNYDKYNHMRSLRILNDTGYIIIFTDGSSTQFIIDKSAHSTTLTFLRKINNYTGVKEIEEKPIKVSEDFFVWIISKVLEGVNDTDSFTEDSEIVVDRIVGFKGSTEDKLAEVRGWGNRIMNVLSTLAFLFEIEKVTHINPRIQYKTEDKSHTIEAGLQLKGNVKVNFEKYVGDYMQLIDIEKESKVILLLYLEVLPKLLTSYENDIENGYWSKDKKIDFFNEIGNDIQKKIKEKINRIK